MPPREFAYGTHYIRKFVSAGFGAPGGGKSSKRMVEALAMASGRALPGVKPVQRLRVWYWNGEDPQEETDRRLAAACLHYGISPEEIEDTCSRTVVARRRSSLPSKPGRAP